MAGDEWRVMNGGARAGGARRESSVRATRRAWARWNGEMAEKAEKAEERKGEMSEKAEKAEGRNGGMAEWQNGEIAKKAEGRNGGNSGRAEWRNGEIAENAKGRNVEKAEGQNGEMAESETCHPICPAQHPTPHTHRGRICRPREKWARARVRLEHKPRTRASQKEAFLCIQSQFGGCPGEDGHGVDTDARRHSIDGTAWLCYAGRGRGRSPSDMADVTSGPVFDPARKAGKARSMTAD
jgi:hypothetical protein